MTSRSKATWVMVRDSLDDPQTEARVRQLCTQLSHRMQQGERQLVEKLLAENPDLAGNVEAQLELIYAEYLTLESCGESVEADVWYRRFPDLKERLQRLFSVHQYFDDTDGRATEAMCQSTGSTLVHQETLRFPGGSEPPVPVSGEIGGYEILEEIGRGGMGIVYRARQKLLDRTVALKIIPRDASDPQSQVRLRREAESVARLHHANVVQIHDVGHEGDCSYLALEYVDGGSLLDLVRAEPLDRADAARLVELVARAMKYAHDRGIVHRDLKPANILLTSDGVPKIADFGLAKQLAGSDDSQTRTGILMGTPAYMSPEQAEGRVREIGPATDVFALGAILYELLTGKPPFRGESDLETLDDVRFNEPIPPRRMDRQIARDLDTICLKCLEKRQLDRYPSAEELADDLKRYIQGDPIRSRKVGWTSRAWRWCRRRPVVASLSIALTCVLIVSAAIVVKLRIDAEGDRRAYNQKTSHLNELVRARETEAERSANTAAKRREELIESQLSEAQSLIQTVGRLRNTPGRENECRTMTESAVETLTRLLNDAPSDERLISRASSASLLYSTLLIETGRWEEARSYAENARRWLASVEGDQERYDIIPCLAVLARAYQLSNEPQRALECYREAYRRVMRYYENHSTSFMPIPIEICSGISQLYRAGGDWDEATRCCEAALALFEKEPVAPNPGGNAVGKPPKRPVSEVLKNPHQIYPRARLVGAGIGRALRSINALGFALAGRAEMLAELSEIATSRGDHVEARRLADEAMAVRREAGVQNLSDGRTRLAHSHLQLARWHTLQAAHDEAASHYRAALDLLNEAARRSARTAESARLIAETQIALANVAASDAECAMALAAAIVQFRVLRGYRIKDWDIYHHIGLLELRAGQVHRRLKENEAAENRLVASRTVFYELSRSAPENQEFRHDELRSLVELIEHFMDQHRSKTAATAFDIALEMGDALVASNPEKESYRRTAARAYSQLAILRGRQRRMNEAMVAYRRAVELDPGVTGQGLFKEAGLWFLQQLDAVRAK